MDDVTEELVEEMIGSTEFFDQLRRLPPQPALWSNLGEDDLVGSGRPGGGRRHVPRLGQSRQSATTTEGADVECLDMEHTNFDVDGRRASHGRELSSRATAPVATAAAMDGWVDSRALLGPRDHDPRLRVRRAAPHRRHAETTTATHGPATKSATATRSAVAASGSALLHGARSRRQLRVTVHHALARRA